MLADPTLFADEREPGSYTAEDAQRFMTHLTGKLALDTKSSAGYEDTWYYLWRERRLPVNVDPFDSGSTTRWSACACGASTMRPCVGDGLRAAALAERDMPCGARGSPGRGFSAAIACI